MLNCPPVILRESVPAEVYHCCLTAQFSVILSASAHIPHESSPTIADVAHVTQLPQLTNESARDPRLPLRGVRRSDYPAASRLRRVLTDSQRPSGA